MSMAHGKIGLRGKKPVGQMSASLRLEIAWEYGFENDHLLILPLIRRLPLRISSSIFSCFVLSYLKIVKLANNHLILLL